MNSAESISVLAVDVMGADLGPREVLEGVRLALPLIPVHQRLILVGNETKIRPILEEKKLNLSDRVQFFHAEDIIEMGESPVQSLKKRRSSMMQALDLVKEGKADALLSCGNTGSLMAGGTLKLRCVDGVDRPALAIVAPAEGHNFVLLDAGANPQNGAQHLVHNAILGDHYARIIFSKPQPRIGLLTIGTEEGKGTENILQAHKVLKQMQGMNYQGLIEGFQVFRDCVDVIVCDGFVGNVLLKTCESLFQFVKTNAKRELKKTLLRRLGACLALGALKDLQKQMNADLYAGAPLLGLKEIVLKAHGSSNRQAIKHAILSGFRLIQLEMNAKIASDITIANQFLSIGE